MLADPAGADQPLALHPDGRVGAVAAEVADQADEQGPAGVEQPGAERLGLGAADFEHGGGQHPAVGVHDTLGAAARPGGRPDLPAGLTERDGRRAQRDDQFVQPGLSAAGHSRLPAWWVLTVITRSYQSIGPGDARAAERRALVSRARRRNVIYRLI